MATESSSGGRLLLVAAASAAAGSLLTYAAFRAHRGSSSQRQAGRGLPQGSPATALAAPSGTLHRVPSQDPHNPSPRTE